MHLLSHPPQCGDVTFIESARRKKKLCESHRRGTFELGGGAERFLPRTRIRTVEKSERQRADNAKDKEKKTRTRADSGLFNLSANVRRLRRDGKTFRATCWYHLAQRLGAQCSGNLTLYLTYVRGAYKWGRGLGRNASVKGVEFGVGGGARGKTRRA